MTPTKWRSMFGAAAATALLALTVGEGARMASADAGGGGGGFEAVAAAEGFRVSYVVPGLIAVEEFFDAGGPVAQAAMENEESSSFASLPYPGALIINGPGLVGFATGVVPPFGYPFYVSAHHPDAPEQQLSDPSGGYNLTAKADGDGSDSVARAAPAGQSGATAGSAGSSTVRHEGNRVVARAVSSTGLVTLGDGALRLSRVESRSETAYAGDGAEPQSTTALVVEGATAGGLTFAYGANGLTVANQGVPLPAKDGLAQLNTALAPTGLVVRFDEGHSGGGRATAGAVTISQTHPIPLNGDTRGTVQIRLGGARSGITLGQGGAAPLPIDAGSPPAPVVPEPPAPADGAPPAEPGGAPSSGTFEATPTGSDLGVTPVAVGKAGPPALGLAFGSSSEPVGALTPTADAGSASATSADSGTAGFPPLASATGTFDNAAATLPAPRRVKGIEPLYVGLLALVLLGVVGGVGLRKVPWSL